MLALFTKKFVVGSCVLVVVALLAGSLAYGLAPAAGGANAPTTVFEIKKGDGFRTIVSELRNDGIIRSAAAAEAFGVLSGTAFRLHPGLYRLNPSMSAPAVLGTLAEGSSAEVSVTIPEGSNLFQIDRILSDALVIRRGDLIAYPHAADLEGRLFPDTYRFFSGSDVRIVLQKLTDNFEAKAAPLLAGDMKNATSDIILASLVDKEVPDPFDQAIVAGILFKRLSAGMPVNIDATLCYMKLLAHPTSGAGCYPITALDKQIDSPYNTYLYKGLPPGPIGNPGTSSILAVLGPKRSPYWFYLSDPSTGKTIFAKTLDEQNANRVKYLESK